MRRISRTVLSYERGDRDTPGVRLPDVLTEEPQLPRLCKTTSAWNKGTLATLDVWEEGTPPNETHATGVTVANVVNKFANVASGKFVSIALHANGHWYLIAAECS